MDGIAFGIEAPVFVVGKMQYLYREFHSLDLNGHKR